MAEQHAGNLSRYAPHCPPEMHNPHGTMFGELIKDIPELTFGWRIHHAGDTLTNGTTIAFEYIKSSTVILCARVRRVVGSTVDKGMDSTVVHGTHSWDSP